MRYNCTTPARKIVEQNWKYIWFICKYNIVDRRISHGKFWIFSHVWVIAFTATFPFYRDLYIYVYTLWLYTKFVSIIRIFGTQTKVKGKHCGKLIYCWRAECRKTCPCAKTISDIKLHVPIVRILCVVVSCFII